MQTFNSIRHRLAPVLRAAVPEPNTEVEPGAKTDVEPGANVGVATGDGEGETPLVGSTLLRVLTTAAPAPAPADAVLLPTAPGTGGR